MSFKAVIFDMDGVLIDSEPMQLSRQKEYLNFLGVSIPEIELLNMVGGNKKMYFKIISKYYSKEDNYKEYYKKYNQYYRNRPIDYSLLLNDGVVDLLEWLTNNNFRLALASSGAPDKIQNVLTQCNIKKYFELVVSGDMFEQSKPHPEIYNTVANKLRLKNSECIAIEDSYYGIEAAKRAKMYTLAKKEERFLFNQGSADIIFDSFNEVKQIII